MSDLNPHSIRTRLGALEAGAFVGVFLSGIVAMQTYLYYRIYTKDKMYLKCLVALLWTLDFTHTIMICVANWIYLVQYFGNYEEADHITWAIPVTVALTAIVTFLVHAFFTHRIYVVSKGRKFIAIPLIFLGLFRLSAALVSTGKMITLMNFREFVRRYEWVFTMGLSSAVALDVLITLGLSYFLNKSKTGFSSMNEIIDLLVRYTVETGIITCAATIASLITWVTMPHQLVFLAIHFTISKLYTNSFLATLNSRATLRARSMSGSKSGEAPSFPTYLTDRRRGSSGPRSRGSTDPLSTAPCVSRPSRDTSAVTSSISGAGALPLQLQITVEKTIERDVDGEIADLHMRSLDEGPSSLDDSGSSYGLASRSRSDAFV